MAKPFSDKYEIIEEIASGGMGVLYKANQLNLNRVVALKVLHTQFTSDPSFLKRFDREARAMARLDHQNILRVYDVGQHENAHYIVMEYFPGKDLRWMTVEKGRFAPAETVEVAIQIAEALAFAHEHGIIHRDIKPGNIMISDRKAVKVGDFGIAAAADEVSLTATGQVLGTPEYMAPEQAKGEPIDGRADLYALGLVMYKMLTGSSPYEGLSKMAIVGKLIYEKDDTTLIYKQPVSNALQQIILKLVRKDPALRYPSARALIDDLTELRESLILDAAQRKRRLKAGSAEATAALETSDVSREPAAPVLSMDPAESGEATATLRRSPGATQAAVPSGPTVVTAAPKSKRPLAIGIGTAALVGLVILYYGMGPKGPDSSMPLKTAPMSSPAVPSVENPPSVADPSAAPEAPSSPAAVSKKETPPSPDEKKMNETAQTEPPGPKTASKKKPEVAAVKQETKAPRSGESLTRPSAPLPAEPKVAPQEKVISKETPQKEAAIIPPDVETQPRRPEEAEREKILALVKHQEAAIESKDVDAYLSDLAAANGEQRKEIAKVFDQYALVDVNFDIQELDLSQDAATLKMVQTTRLVYKTPRPEQRTKTRVLWKLGKMENAWKIRDTQVLEKIP